MSPSRVLKHPVDFQLDWLVIQQHKRPAVRVVKAKHRIPTMVTADVLLQ